MKKLLLLLIAAAANAVTLPLYIDTETNTVVSPDAPTTLAGYGITDADPIPFSIGLNYLLFGDGGGGWTQKKESNAQDALGIRGSNDGGQVGSNSSTTYGGAVGRTASSTTGFAGGLLSTTESGAAIGNGSISTDGFAFGYDAIADGTGRGQLGTGTNSTDNTIQFLDSGSITSFQFGRLAVQTRLITSSGFALISDHVIFASNSISIKVSLLSAATVGDGYILRVKNVGTGPVTVDSTGVETIDGELSIILTTQYESVTLVSDGSNWFIL